MIKSGRFPKYIYPKFDDVLVKTSRQTPSIIDELLKAKKIDKNFLDILDKLSLEDIIAVKLERSVRKSLVGKFYGFPIEQSLFYICREAVFKFALSAVKQQKDVPNFLGTSRETFNSVKREFRLSDYFQELIKEQVKEEDDERALRLRKGET